VFPRTGTSFPSRLGVHPQCVLVHGDLADRFNRSWTRVDVLVTSYTDAAVRIPVREVISRFLPDDSLARDAPAPASWITRRIKVNAHHLSRDSLASFSVAEKDAPNTDRSPARQYLLGFLQASLRRHAIPPSRNESPARGVVSGCRIEKFVAFLLSDASFRPLLSPRSQRATFRNSSSSRGTQRAHVCACLCTPSSHLPSFSPPPPTLPPSRASASARARTCAHTYEIFSREIWTRRIALARRHCSSLFFYDRGRAELKDAADEFHRR